MSDVEQQRLADSASMRSSLAAAGHVPVPPSLSARGTGRKPRMQFRLSAAPRSAAVIPPKSTAVATGPEAVAAALPVGVHEPEVFAAVASSLPADTSLLHAVTHTHQCFPRTRGAEGNAPVGGPGEDITTELARISREVEAWKLQRLQKLRETTQETVTARSAEQQMEHRIFGKRTDEQDRALRRMAALLASMEALHERCQRDSTAEPTVASAGASSLVKDDNAGEGERSSLQESHSSPTEQAPASRWLQERNRQQAREARLCCEQHHALGAQSIAHEEEMERRALLLTRLHSANCVRFAEDEALFRARLCERESVCRQTILHSALALLHEQRPTSRQGRSPLAREASVRASKEAVLGDENGIVGDAPEKEEWSTSDVEESENEQGGEEPEEEGGRTADEAV